MPPTPGVSVCKQGRSRCKAGGEFGALLDRALGIEFGRQRRPADHVRVDSVTAQAVLEFAHRLLTRADHHVVDRQHLLALAVGAEADVQAVVVDAFVVHARQLGDALRLQRRPMHPARRLAEPLALRAHLVRCNR